MTALEYMKRQAEINKRNFSVISKKKGVLKSEINNIKNKISYYREAARALEGVQSNAIKVVISEKYGSYRCPRCDKVLYPSERYCFQCGQKLDWNIYDKEGNLNEQM